MPLWDSKQCKLKIGILKHCSTVGHVVASLKKVNICQLSVAVWVISFFFLREHSKTH